jgi:cytochrome c oxidase subunit III
LADQTIVAEQAGHGHVQEHPRHQHHFDTMEQQYDSSSFGMWVFLIQEVMFFGGLFAAYLVYRHSYYDAFGQASSTLNLWLGAFNTVVLIGSSLTMALAVNSAQLGNRKLLMFFLLATMVLGSIFLGVKVIEYKDKYEEAHIPGNGADLGIIKIQPFCFHPVSGPPCPADAEKHEGGAEHGSATAPEAAPVPGETMTTGEGHNSGEAGVALPTPASPRERSMPGAEIYFSLYFAMTGMHALHMVIGMAIMVWLLWNAYRGIYSGAYFTPIENFGLYWHFVDIIWIYLFPLLYLINRHLGHH